MPQGIAGHRLQLAHPPVRLVRVGAQVSAAGPVIRLQGGRAGQNGPAGGHRRPAGQGRAGQGHRAHRRLLAHLDHRQPAGPAGQHPAAEEVKGGRRQAQRALDAPHQDKQGQQAGGQEQANPLLRGRGQQADHQGGDEDAHEGLDEQMHELPQVSSQEGLGVDEEGQQHRQRHAQIEEHRHPGQDQAQAVLGDGRGNGHQGKQQPLDAVAGQRFGQLLVGLVTQVDARRIAKGEVVGFEVHRELAAVQLVQVGHAHEGGHQVEAAQNAVAVDIGDGRRQPGVGAVHVGDEHLAGRAVEQRLVNAGIERLPQRFHDVNHHDGRGKEEEGDEAVAEQLAGVHPAVGGQDVVQHVPESEGGQGQDEEAAQRRRQGVDHQLDEVADVVGQPAVDALGNDGHGEQRPVHRPQQLGQGVL